MSTCPFLSAAGRQKSADGQIQVRRCRKSRKQSHRLFGTQGTQKRARTETFPGLAKLSLRGICPLGCVMEIARNPEKKVACEQALCLSARPKACSQARKKEDRFAKRKLSFLERKSHVQQHEEEQEENRRGKQEEKGRGYGITAVFFHPRRRPT